MKVLTDEFEMDKKTQLIECNAKRTSRKGYRRKVVLVSNTFSNWTQTHKPEVDASVGFRTEFKLYRSTSEYLLQIVGVSDRPSVFPNKYKVIKFVDPEECMSIIEDDSNFDLYMSDPVLNLLDAIQDSPYITQWEKNRWERCLVDEEEDV